MSQLRVARPIAAFNPLSLATSRTFKAPAGRHQSFAATETTSTAKPSSSVPPTLPTPRAATATPPSFTIPTVDIAPYLSDPSSLAAQRVIEQINRACRSTGFFQIVNHGVPAALQSEVFRAAERFFRLPLEEKKKLDAKTTVGHRGYDVLESQSYEEGVLPDLKEVSQTQNPQIISSTKKEN